MRGFLFSAAALFAVTCNAAASNKDPSALVILRVEGADRTIFEGPVLTRGHNITTASGGSHRCNGLNNNENSKPGPTCTSALDDASRSHNRFTYDGTFFAEFEDYFITRIGTSAQTSTQFWGLLLNFQFTPVGGCQQEVKNGQEVLWAFDAFNKQYFLKASGPLLVQKNKPTKYHVVDGTTGNSVAGATLGGASTDANGEATLTFNSFGEHTLKAEHPNGIRSNALPVIVI